VRSRNGLREVGRIGTGKWDEQVLRIGETVPMKKPAQHLIAEVPRRQPRVENRHRPWRCLEPLLHTQRRRRSGDRGRFRTNPKGVEKWFTHVPPARVAMEAGTHSIWISEQLQKSFERRSITGWRTTLLKSRRSGKRLRHLSGHEGSLCCLGEPNHGIGKICGNEPCQQ
jgi:hypothetical protein